jgi:hypothetical protein
LHTSPVFLAAANAAASLTEATIVKSLRAYATDTFDIQMIVVDKARPRRGRHAYASAGGYKVRRKDWAEVTQRFSTFSPEYWDTRTIYIVRSHWSQSSCFLHVDRAQGEHSASISLDCRNI